MSGKVAGTDKEDMFLDNFHEICQGAPINGGEAVSPQNIYLYADTRVDLLQTNTVCNQEDGRMTVQSFPYAICVMERRCCACLCQTARNQMP